MFKNLVTFRYAFNEHFSISLVLTLSVILQWLFFLPYYLPSDTVNYLNANDILNFRILGETIHIVRLGMVGPTAFLRLFGLHELIVLYGLLTSAGTILITYRLGLFLGNKTKGLIAAVIVSLTPIHVIFGAPLLPDGPLVFFALLSFYLIITTVANPAQAKTKFLASGLLLGLAYTCKVTALFFCVPALGHIFFTSDKQTRIQSAIIFFSGLAFIFIAEITILKFMLNEWHFRIIETLGFIDGTKGNYIEVDKDIGWWIEQIRFKIGAFLWAEHLPTALLYLAIPHLYLVSLWKLLPDLKKQFWVISWGFVWIGQQLVISPIEQDPRYMQAVIPFAAIIIALGLGSYWDTLSKSIRNVIIVAFMSCSITSASIFYSTFLPLASAINDYSSQLDLMGGKNNVIDGASEYEVRLANYFGWTTPLTATYGEQITHVARLSYGYTKDQDQSFVIPTNMERIFHSEHISPLKDIFQFLDINPGVGSKSSISIYH